MTWDALNTINLIASSFVVGVGVATYVQARTGRRTNPHLALALTLIGTSGVLNAGIPGSRVAAVLALVLVLAAFPPLWWSLRSPSGGDAHATDGSG